jgi:hypothetical protein
LPRSESSDPRRTGCLSLRKEDDKWTIQPRPCKERHGYICSSGIYMFIFNMLNVKLCLSTAILSKLKYTSSNMPFYLDETSTPNIQFGLNFLMDLSLKWVLNMINSTVNSEHDKPNVVCTELLYSTISYEHDTCCW